nr:PREDICTED: protocadherin Fat 4-like [Stegastes partitus]
MTKKEVFSTASTHEPSSGKAANVSRTVVGKVETQFGTLTPITYSVQEDDGENLFLLSRISGEFLLSRSLDFETQRYYILTVALQQGDSQVSSVRVYFNVLDVNDNPPVFSQHAFSAWLLEDTEVGTCFLWLNVSDKDDGDNGELKLRVVSGDEEEVFFIHSTGNLCLNKELDRERRSSYNLTVTASDCVQPASSQLTSTAHVVVVVEDANDNAPVFVSPKSVNIPEDTPLRSVIMTVHAEDSDAGFNGKLLYDLSNTSGGMFSIDNRSGEIYLEEMLDREEVDTLIITVTATDGGSPQMATAMNLTVHVEDANDHSPEFLQSDYSLTVREDIPRGTSLFHVQACDQDIGPNGLVRYTITQVTPFVVDTVRGVVTVMGRLDREIDPNYTFIITAVDQGNMPRSATAAVSVTVLDVNDFAPQFSPETLIIHIKENEEDPSERTRQVLLGLGTLTVHVIVEDVNDNHPEFTEDVYNTIVPEDSPIGTVFAMITASDIDEGVNGEIR